MARYINQALGTVFVNRGTAIQKTIPKDIRDCIDGRFQSTLVHDPAQWCPRGRTDFYIYRSMLSAAIEHAASIATGSDVQLICMSKGRATGEPVGGPYLAAEISRRCAEGDDVWIYQPSSDPEWLHRTD